MYLVRRVHREVYYLKKWIRHLSVNRQVQKKIDYEAYYEHGRGSNYDHFWVVDGIPLWFINEQFLSPRIDELERVVGGPLRGFKLLDLGCSGGGFLRLAEAHGMKTCGIDISRLAVEEVRQTTKSIVLQCDLSIQQIPFKDHSFDVVTAFDLVEHVKNTKHLFSEVKRVLKPGGVFYFITPNGHQPADRDATHFSLKSKQEWERITRSFFQCISCYTYNYFPPPPYLYIQRILQTWHKLRGFKIEQVVVIARKQKET